MSRPTARILVLLSLALATACDKVPLLAPTQSRIDLSVSSTTLPVNGTALVIATVTEQAGTPVQNGTLVTFTGSLGTFDPREVETVNSRATTTFRASGQSGTTKLGAVSGSAKATEVEVKIGGAAAEAVALRAEPTTVPVTGGRVTLIAVVTDASGNPLVGAPVAFSADNGILSSSSGITDANGEARTSLETDRETIARATVGAKNGQVTVRAINLPTASISFSPANPIVGLPVQFTITPGSTTGGRAIRSVAIDFGDGSQPRNLGAISAATSVQYVYNRADTYTVTVTVTDISGQQTASNTVITVQRAVVGVAFTSPPSSGQVGTPVTFTVAVTNPSNIPIQSVSVNFGDGSSPATLAGGTGGSVQKTYTRSATFTVRATATDSQGTRYEATHSILITPQAPIEVTLDAQSAEDGSPMTCVPAGNNYPKTCNIRFVGGGVRVQFAAMASGLASVSNYRWDFADGTSETTTDRRVDHIFRSRGDFRVTVLVTTTTGQTGSQYITIIVQ